MEDESRALRAVVHGRVQGVGFRYFVLDSVADLKLTGWVRNRRDGAVEVLAEGPHEHLDALLDCLRQGPRAARVEQVETEWPAPTGQFRQFEITHV